MNVRIRGYEEADSEEVGRLIADVLRKSNLSCATSAEQDRLLAPFRHDHSADLKHQRAIAAVLGAPLVLVAMDGQTGRSSASCTEVPVDCTVCSCGGRTLVAESGGSSWIRSSISFATRAATGWITLQSMLYAVPFYRRLGYERSTGMRSGRCFDGIGFPYQPIKRLLAEDPSHPDLSAG